jgi:alkanesulfonate monooxygenase SsuD/methylene tetrahydromethanopterin reductase-like flavin-dependent oxidoreductase (luciferase family)
MRRDKYTCQNEHCPTPKKNLTVDHISGGRMDFGIGAGWHQDEHRGYGIDFPGPGSRVEMLDEALTVIRRPWTEESVSFSGRFFTLTDALCEPKPIQRPHPPIVIGGSKPKMLRVIARQADEWNMPSHSGPAEWGEANARLDVACADVGREPTQVRRSVQLFLHPAKPGQVDEQLDLLPQYRDLGCEHAVLSFYQPPPLELLQRCAAL